MLVRLEKPKNNLVVLLSVQVSPAQLGEKNNLKNTPPFLNVFTILVSYNSNTALTLLYFKCQKQEKNSLEEEKSTNKKRLF